MSGPPPLLRDPNFRRLYLAQVVSWLGDRTVPIALAFAVLELGGGAGEVGVVLAARSLPLVATLLAGGVIADRLPRRAVMVASDVARVLTQGLLAALLVLGTAEVWMVAVLAGLTGAAGGFFNPAATGLMPAVVGTERLQEANGLRAIGLSLGEVAGPVLAGVLVATVGAGWALGLDAITFVLSAVLLARLRLPAHEPPDRTSFVRELRDGWDAFRSRRWVWTFVASAMVGNAAFAAWQVLGPVVADRDLGGADTWGLIIGALGAGSIVGGLLALRLRPARPLVASIAGFALFVPPLVLLAAGASPVVLALATFLTGAGMLFGNTVWESTLQRHVPLDTLSRVSSYDWFGSFAIQPIGLAIWGPIAVLAGVDAALLLAAGIQALSLLLLLGVREIRTLT